MGCIDFEQGTISVKRTVTSTIIDGKYQEFEQQSAKTKSSLRTLPLIGSFREYFMQVKEAQELNKQVCGNCYNHEYDGFVFVDELGERMRANYLTSAFLKFLEDHGLRRMRFHDLRHSCASLLLPMASPSSTFRSGWDIATLPPRRISTPTWITNPRSPRHRRWRQGLPCRRAATSAAAGGRSVPGRTSDFLP